MGNGEIRVCSDLGSHNDSATLDLVEINHEMFLRVSHFPSHGAAIWRRDVAAEGQSHDQFGAGIYKIAVVDAVVRKPVVIAFADEVQVIAISIKGRPLVVVAASRDLMRFSSLGVIHENGLQ